jgi:AraC-like DNA-binding protein
MKPISYPQWKGFELTPQGGLLEQFIDFTGKMGLAYERCVEFYKDFHTHDRLMLVFPRGASSMEVRTQAPRETFKIDSHSLLIVPKDIVHDDEGTSAIYDTFALYPDDAIIREAAEDQGIQLSDLDRISKKCVKLKRSQWLEQMLQQYFFERVIEKKSRKQVQMLEHVIMCEVLKQFFGLKNKCEDDLQNDADIGAKAVRYIETNLFAPLSNIGIAKQIGASESDLLRKFRAVSKTTPYSYIKNRRLEEATKLLKGSEHSVGDVALLVGYNNFGAFSDAFKRKYGQAPLEWKKSQA